MGSNILVFLLAAFLQILVTFALAENQEVKALESLKNVWNNTPPNWNGLDPCGAWEGIVCTGSHVTTIRLASTNLTGELSGAIESLSALSELQTLDLSYNQGLTGVLPGSIGNLKNLLQLILIGCGFSGSIPDSLGSLLQLEFLALNINSFSGNIPPSIGSLSNLSWLDLSDNQLNGPIPVSSGNTPGLDMLVKALHFHFGNNKLSGEIPPELFSSNRVLIHLIFDNNQFVGSIPSNLGLVQSLEVIRLDRNSLSGHVPTNLNHLPNVTDLYLSNNKLSGPLPNLTGMNLLQYVDISNNSFDAAVIPAWFLTIQSLTTLMMENIQLQGQINVSLFSLPNLETMVLKNNQLNGTLNLGTNPSYRLKLIDLQNNRITDFNPPGGAFDAKLILVGNDVCGETGAAAQYCTISKPNVSYSTQPNNCIPVSCGSDQISSPNCKCAYPYSGILSFKAFSFSDFTNFSYFSSIEYALMRYFQTHQFPVDSVYLSNPDHSYYLQLNLSVFPSGQDRFNLTGITMIAFIFSNQLFKPPNFFGPYSFIASGYEYFAAIPSVPNNSSSMGIIIGAVAGGAVFLLLLLVAGVYGFRQKRKVKRMKEQHNPFASWDPKNNSGSIPQLSEVRSFSFQELKKYTGNFADTNAIGFGGYGKVYRGTLPSGELVAIKRAQQGSMQGGLEFKTEIEMLSRVHHKNVVSLLGFCFDQDEQMLVYEYIVNGTLKASLAGRSGIKLQWTRRLRIALGAARGLAYLHELANPPIIHRDIKSDNILLDEHLKAKVADFGLSKLLNDSGHVTTQVKGTMGYMDPEYFMTQQLTDKSDVYSFGVLMLELITARPPIVRGKYIVREIKTAMDMSKDLYNLQEILDPAISLGPTTKGLEMFVDIAMSCVRESGADRPTMGEVVKQIENIMQVAGLNPNAESATTSGSHEETKKGNNHHPYSNEALFDYSGVFLPSSSELQQVRTLR